MVLVELRLDELQAAIKQGIGSQPSAVQTQALTPVMFTCWCLITLGTYTSVAPLAGNQFLLPVCIPMALMNNGRVSKLIFREECDTHGVRLRP